MARNDGCAELRILISWRDQVIGRSYQIFPIKMPTDSSFLSSAPPPELQLVQSMIAGYTSIMKKIAVPLMPLRTDSLKAHHTFAKTNVLKKAEKSGHPLVNDAFLKRMEVQLRVSFSSAFLSLIQGLDRDFKPSIRNWPWRNVHLF